MKIPLWAWCLAAAGSAVVGMMFLVKGNAFDAPGKATAWGVLGMGFCALVPWSHSFTHALIVTVVASLAGCLDLS